MLKFIIGVKGTGKTKTLINLVNGALAVTKGDVVCIEKGTKLRYDIKPSARLVDVDEYMVGDAQSLYGFIAVSGLKMIQKVDLEDHANLFTVSVILICGIGGMAISIGKVTITAIACALILGIIVNILLHKFQKKED